MAKKKPASFGIAFWLGLVLLGAVLYLAFTVDFKTLLSRSGIGDAIRKSFGGDYRTEPEKNSGKSPAPPVPAVREEEPEVKPAPVKTTAPLLQVEHGKEPAAPAPKPVIAEKPNTTGTVKPAAKPVPPRKEAAPLPKEVRMYFVRLGEDGRVNMVPAVRMLPSAETILTDLVGELLAGPSPEEKKRGFISLIPAGTKLLAASVKDETAYVNLNEAFRFNTFGVEGFTAQLRQFIFTLTELPGLKKVQILIEGIIVDYLSPEGIFIGRPLGRENF